LHWVFPATTPITSNIHKKPTRKRERFALLSECDFQVVVVMKDSSNKANAYYHYVLAVLRRQATVFQITLQNYDFFLTYAKKIVWEGVFFDWYS
jgi:hypothetical protein